MTRDEFEALLEEAFMAGYEDAIDEIFEEDNTFDLEDEMDSYLEDSHQRNAIRQFSIGGIKHGRSKDIGKKFQKDLRKQGINVLNNDDVVNNQDRIKQAKEKMENSKAYKKFAKYFYKNQDKINQFVKDGWQRRKEGKIKDLKTRIFANKMNNVVKSNTGKDIDPKDTGYYDL